MLFSQEVKCVTPLLDWTDFVSVKPTGRRRHYETMLKLGSHAALTFASGRECICVAPHFISNPILQENLQKVILLERTFRNRTEPKLRILSCVCVCVCVCM
jgi:hypothetical protein